MSCPAASFWDVEIEVLTTSTVEQIDEFTVRHAKECRDIPPGPKCRKGGTELVVAL